MAVGVLLVNKLNRHDNNVFLQLIADQLHAKAVVWKLVSFATFFAFLTTMVVGIYWFLVAILYLVGIQIFNLHATAGLVAVAFTLAASVFAWLLSIPPSENIANNIADNVEVGRKPKNLLGGESSNIKR